MIGVYSPYPSYRDYQDLLETMLVVLRDAQRVSTLKTLANDPDRGAAQKFAANCIMVTRNIITSLNELYFDNDTPIRVVLVHLPDEGWSLEFHETNEEP